jgi:hypothetical protein
MNIQPFWLVYAILKLVPTPSHPMYSGLNHFYFLGVPEF